VRLLRAQCLHGLRDFAGVRREIEGLGGEAAIGGAATLLLAAADLALGSPQAALARLGTGEPSPAALDDFRVLRARCRLELGDFTAAEREVAPLVERDPEHAEALALLAECRLLAGDADGALAHGLASAALHLAHPRVHLTIGRAFLAIGSPREAVTAFEAAVALAPGWDEARAALDTARRAAPA
jgi:tetratricopeptide (TPR) repeat protein